MSILLLTIGSIFFTCDVHNLRPCVPDPQPADDWLSLDLVDFVDASDPPARDSTDRGSDVHASIENKIPKVSFENIIHATFFPPNFERNRN
jgi:hypothetical protein